MKSDVAKIMMVVLLMLVIIQNQQLPSVPTFYEISQKDKPNNDVGARGLPEAQDMGAYHTFGTANASTGPVASGVYTQMVNSAYYNPPYSIPMNGPVFGDEIKQQIAEARMSEQAELKSK